MTPDPLFVGIDVAKAHLDVALGPDGAVARHPNDEGGIAAVLAALAASPPDLVVLEATGSLEVPLACALAAAGLPVAVVNPLQARRFAQATGRTAKTDALDARDLALFAERVRPEPRPLPDAAARELAELLARRRQLVAMRTAEKNRTCTAANAAMYSADRTAARPPTSIRRPRNVPLSRFMGARPTNAPTLRRPSVPSSGSSPSSVRDATGPMPGMLRNSSSRSRHTGLARTVASSRRSITATCRLG